MFPGKDWLLTTRGTDITEAFESSHISASAEKMLSRYYLKDAATPRVSPYTFHDDGFFRTFKRKVRREEGGCMGLVEDDYVRMPKGREG